MKPKAALVDLKKVSFTYLTLYHIMSSTRRGANVSLSSLKLTRSITLFPYDDCVHNQVLSLDPANAPAKAQLDATQKLLRRLQFEAAIAAKDEILTSYKIIQQLKEGASPIDPTYAGPRLEGPGEGDLITEEFVNELIEWFKKGETIPRRLAWKIVLGAYDKLKEEKSLVKVTIPKGETINV